MIYIVETNPAGYKEYSDEHAFDTYKEALEYVDSVDACHGAECEFRIYEAVNEYTYKRRLLLER